MAMAGYTKLFASIIASTIWRADDKTRIVWITMLAMSDQFGIVEGSVPGLADMARVTIDECREALDALQQPDEDSRSKEQDGRRIEPIEGGWRLINHGKYRDKMSVDERREYQRLYQRSYRKRKGDINTNPDKSTKFDIQNISRTEAEEKDGTAATPHPAPIISRRRKDAAWEGPRLYVPQRLHSDLIALRGPGSESKLLAWYLLVSDEWTDGARKDDEPGADMFAFWKARYGEEWPATPAVKSTRVSRALAEELEP